MPSEEAKMFNGSVGSEPCCTSPEPLQAKRPRYIIRITPQTLQHSAARAQWKYIEYELTTTSRLPSALEP